MSENARSQGVRPLEGLVVAVTRAADQSAGLTDLLCAEGASVIEAPTIEIGPVDDYSAVDEALRQARGYDWLVLTSTNGVAAMFERLGFLGLGREALAGPRVAAIGSGTTAALVAFGVQPDLVPQEAVGEALAESMIRAGVAGRRVLLLRSEIARGDLVDALNRAGATCHDLAIYRTSCPQGLPEAFLRRFDDGAIDWLTLTSPSSLTNLLCLLGRERSERLRGVRLASIGPVTTRAIREAGFEAAAAAEPHDVGGLVAAIVGKAKSQNVKKLKRRKRS